MYIYIKEIIKPIGVIFRYIMNFHMTFFKSQFLRLRFACVLLTSPPLLVLYARPFFQNFHLKTIDELLFFLNFRHIRATVAANCAKHASHLGSYKTSINELSKFVLLKASHVLSSEQHKAPCITVTSSTHTLRTWHTTERHALLIKKRKY